MQLSKLFLVAAAVAAVQAAVQFTNSAFSGITAGTPFTITWTGASGSVTINLKNGPSTALVTVGQITSGATGTSFTWTPDTTITDGTYALEIIDSAGGPPNYSVQFQITGGSGTSSTTGSSSGSITLTGSSTSSHSTSSRSTSGTSSVPSLTTSLSTTTSVALTTTLSSSSTGFHNTTTSSGTTKASSTKASSTTGASTSTSTPPSGNFASGLASPLAMVFLALAAIVCLN